MEARKPAPKKMGAKGGGSSQRHNRLPLKQEVVPMRRIISSVVVAFVTAALLLAMAMLRSPTSR